MRKGREGGERRGREGRVESERTVREGRWRAGCLYGGKESRK